MCMYVGCRCAFRRGFQCAFRLATRCACPFLYGHFNFDLRVDLHFDLHFWNHQGSRDNRRQKAPDTRPSSSSITRCKRRQKKGTASADKSKGQPLTKSARHAPYMHRTRAGRLETLVEAPMETPETPRRQDVTRMGRRILFRAQLCLASPPTHARHRSEERRGGKEC